MMPKTAMKYITEGSGEQLSNQGQENVLNLGPNIGIMALLTPHLAIVILETFRM